jgi:hypothetical protein
MSDLITPEQEQANHLAKAANLQLGLFLDEWRAWMPLRIEHCGADQAGALFNPTALTALLKALSPGGSGPEMQLRMGAFLPLYYGVSMLLTSFVACGLLRLWNWTRIFILVVVGVSLLAVLITAPLVWRNISFGASGLWFLRLGLCLWIGTYLLSRRVRTAFAGRVVRESVGSTAQEKSAQSISLTLAARGEGDSNPRYRC